MVPHFPAEAERTPRSLRDHPFTVATTDGDMGLHKTDVIAP